MDIGNRNQGENSSSSRPTVEIRNVSKWFGDVTALDNVSLNIQQGEFFSLLGPSGCGKTTLLRMIGGFETPSDGQILIDDTDTIGKPPYARSTNMIFQHLALFPHMNVTDNVAFGLKMKSFNSETIEQKVQEALELVRLEGYGLRKIDQLSGGQKQRVAMARALINNPSVLLLDEPLGALDLQLRLQMQDELRRLHKSLGNTFIFVTHDQGEAMAMSDRIAVMDQGNILQVGTPEDIYETPRTRFVADFVGHTNVFDGHVTKIEDNGECLVSCLSLVFRCVAPKELAIDQPVSIALRFENVSVEDVVNRADGTSLSVLVTEKMYLGGMFRLKTITEDGTELTADTPISSKAQSISEGDKIKISWNPNDLSVLLE
tara:strand:+ start:15314 stop:16435 length:1122 start_codon:yes stop_codon:yes gene_type:complete